MRVGGLLIGAMVATAAMGALSPALAHAGSFSVSPLRVDFSQRAQTGALTIRSRQDAEVVVEAQVVSWSQNDGADELTPTRDVLVSPVVFALPPNGSQLVRVALLRSADPQREQSYRLILTEVPPQAEPGFTGLNVALRISLPIFVAASAPIPEALEWSAVRGSGDTVNVTARNVGNTHARVLNFAVASAESPDQGTAERTAAYILPDQAKTWPVAIHQQDGTSGDWRRLRLTGATEAGDFELEIGPNDR